MSTTETRNLLTHEHEHEPSEDIVEEGLAAYPPTTAGGFTCFKSARKRRASWFIHLSDAFLIRRLVGTDVRRVILKVSLLFGCTWLAIWIFWPSGKWSRGLTVRCFCRHQAAHDPFSQINIGSTSTNRPASST